MALQPFVVQGPIFQFPNPLHNRQDSLDRGLARRKAVTYTEDSTDTE
jgi:hypothetical protein